MCRIHRWDYIKMSTTPSYGLCILPCRKSIGKTFLYTIFERLVRFGTEACPEIYTGGTTQRVSIYLGDGGIIEQQKEEAAEEKPGQDQTNTTPRTPRNGENGQDTLTTELFRIPTADRSVLNPLFRALLNDLRGFPSARVGAGNDQ